jgi:hypothetical protein
MFYVYEHWRPDRDEPFYVGKGRGGRANMMARRNRHHKAIQAKLHRLGLAVEVRIVASDLSEQAAFDLEKQRISMYISNGIDLANMTIGGEGPAGRIGLRGAKNPNFGKPSPMRGKKMRDEQRHKISIAMKGKKTRLGAVLSEETKRKIADAHKGKLSSMKGIPKSEEHKAKISVSVSKAQMGNKNHFYGRKHTEETKAKISATKRSASCRTAP